MAKKKLSRDQRRKQKRQRRRNRQAPVDPGQPLARRIRQQGFGQKIVRNPAGETKMSKVLLEFMAPYRHLVDDKESMSKLVITAIVAWNTALLPEEERAGDLAKVAEALPPETHEDFHIVVNALIERKERHFAQYDRPIVDYELVGKGNDYRLTVTSLMPQEENKENGE